MRAHARVAIGGGDVRSGAGAVPSRRRGERARPGPVRGAGFRGAGAPSAAGPRTRALTTSSPPFLRVPGVLRGKTTAVTPGLLLLAAAVRFPPPRSPRLALRAR